MLVAFVARFKLGDLGMKSFEPNFLGATPRFIAALSPIIRALRAYHRHEVYGLEHLAGDRPMLVAINHSLATYDGVLFCGEVIEQLGRVPVGLGDNQLFRTPGLRKLVHRAGIVPASPLNGETLLARGRLVMVAPGGMREALRPSTERYQVRWGTRQGFVRLALRARVPIVFVACPAADDLYTVRESRLTKVAYKYLKWPVPIIHGVGPTFIPRPVRLVHLVSEPQNPPEGDFGEDLVDAWHRQLLMRMDALMTEARAL